MNDIKRTRPFVTLAIRGHSNAMVVVTSELGKVVTAEIDRVSEIRRKQIEDFPGESQGVIYDLIRSAALRLDKSEDCVARRYYGIRNGDSLTTNFYEWADPLLTAIGINFRQDTDIAVLPSNKSTAQEMVEAYCESRDPEMTELERKKLAKKLLRFAIGYVHAETLMAQDEWPEEVPTEEKPFKMPEPVAV